LVIRLVIIGAILRVRPKITGVRCILETRSRIADLMNTGVMIDRQMDTDSRIEAIVRKRRRPQIIRRQLVIGAVSAKMFEMEVRLEITREITGIRCRGTAIEMFAERIRRTGMRR
jgi:hypothetical protein